MDRIHKQLNENKHISAWWPIVWNIYEFQHKYDLNEIFGVWLGTYLWLQYLGSGMSGIEKSQGLRSKAHLHYIHTSTTAIAMSNCQFTWPCIPLFWPASNNEQDVPDHSLALNQLYAESITDEDDLEMSSDSAASEEITSRSENEPNNVQCHLLAELMFYLSEWLHKYLDEVDCHLERAPSWEALQLMLRSLCWLYIEDLHSIEVIHKEQWWVLGVEWEIQYYQQFNSKLFVENTNSQLKTWFSWWGECPNRMSSCNPQATTGAWQWRPSNWECYTPCKTLT